jgi:hypothetical protein
MRANSKRLPHLEQCGRSLSTNFGIIRTMRGEGAVLFQITLLLHQCIPALVGFHPNSGLVRVGLNWGGQPDPINRLLIGFAQSTGAALLEAGVAPEQLPNLLSVIQAKTQAPLVVPAMPIQDAIELADFLVDMTKKFFRFYPGADVVGGETDIAVVTRHEKFKWVKRKHYYPADLNPTELDHA